MRFCETDLHIWRQLRGFAKRAHLRGPSRGQGGPAWKANCFSKRFLFKNHSCSPAHLKPKAYSREQAFCIRGVQAGANSRKGGTEEKHARQGEDEAGDQCATQGTVGGAAGLS